MSEDCILAVRWKEQCNFITLRATESYKSLQEQVRGKWVDLQSSDFSFSCSFGDFTNACLESDDDLVSIFNILKTMPSRIVKVEVVHVSQSKTSSKESDPNSNSNSSVNRLECVPYDPVPGEIVEFGGAGSIPHFDVSPALDKKSFLSDNWSELFKNGVGSIFSGGSVEFRTSLRKYSTKMGFRFKFIKNTSSYIHVICFESQNTGCEWYIRAKLLKLYGAFVIYKCNFTHQCVGMLLKDKTKRLCPKIIGKLLLGDVKSKPDMAPKDVVDVIRNSYGMEIPYYRAFRAVESAKEQIYGSFDDSYQELHWYCEAVERTNPGSIVDLQENSSTHCFERLFIAFKACLEGFKHCRPLLFLDGTFLKGRAKGTLLAATAKDGNNGLFPVAYALVSAENISNWEWFVRNIKDNIVHDEEIIYISDRNLGLLSALNNVFDEPKHFYCLFHLLTNLHDRFSSGWSNNQRVDLGDIFKAAAYAPDERLFNQSIQLFLHVGGKMAEDFLDQLPYEKWAAAHSPHIRRYGEMTSNAAESFNNWILDARSLPVTKLVDRIRQNISGWFVDRRDACQGWTTPLVPQRQINWDYMYELGSSWIVARSPGGDFEVQSEVSCTVDLRRHYCSCGQWFVTGFPCVHAVTVICRHETSIFTHIDKCFYTSEYIKCYQKDLNPIPNTLRFACEPSPNQFKMLPPILNRRPGRPKKNRITSYGEFPKKKPKLCSSCGKRGMHDHTCTKS